MTSQVEMSETNQVECQVEDLIPGAGIALIHGSTQVAVFYFPEEPEQVFAVSNYDPLGEANVISRGIPGDLKGQLVVASPLYKQHFNLRTGQCLEDESVCLKCFDARIEDNRVIVQF